MYEYIPAGISVVPRPRVVVIGVSEIGVVPKPAAGLEFNIVPWPMLIVPQYGRQEKRKGDSAVGGLSKEVS